MIKINKFNILAIILIILSMAFTANAAQTGLILNNPIFQAVDSEGIPISGSLVYGYVPGTTTPKDTYSDRACTIPNPWPVVLDANGQAIIYILGATKINLKSAAGVQQDHWPIDYIQGFAEPPDLTHLYPDYRAADQGVTGENNTIKYYIDQAAGDAATIHLLHNSGAATTTYALDTDLAIPGKITLEIDSGAIISGVGVLNADCNIIASKTQIFDFTLPGWADIGTAIVSEAYIEWFGGGSDKIDTVNYAAINKAVIAVNGHYPIKFLTGVYNISAGLSDIPSYTQLIGVNNSFAYGPGGPKSSFKFTGGTAGITATLPYLTIKDIYIDGNGVLDYGFAGGFVSKLESVLITDCNVAGLRIASVPSYPQTSRYINCAFNGNYAGVEVSNNTTQYFDGCVFRENTTYGITGALGGSITFLKCIIEKNLLSGLNATRSSNGAHFIDCYFESNDTALSSSGYHMIIDTTGIANPIIFDKSIFGGMASEKILNLISGAVRFNACQQIGSYLTPQITKTAGSEVVLDKSFSRYPMPNDVKYVPEMSVQKETQLPLNGSGCIQISSKAITFDTNDFTVNAVVAPNEETNTTRTLLGGNVDGLTISLVGNSYIMQTIAFAKVGEAAFAIIGVSMPTNMPTHIMYSRISNMGYLYINGTLIHSFADANDYSGVEYNICKDVGGTVYGKMALYEFSLYSIGLTAQNAFTLWRNNGNNKLTGLTSNLTLDLEFNATRATSVIYDNVSSANINISGSANWAIPN